jgi:hypothetical protein
VRAHALARPGARAARLQTARRGVAIRELAADFAQRAARRTQRLALGVGLFSAVLCATGAASFSALLCTVEALQRGLCAGDLGLVDLNAPKCCVTVKTAMGAPEQQQRPDLQGSDRPTLCSETVRLNT